MDAVTLYAIYTLANGKPHILQRPIPAQQCERLAKSTRAAYPTAVVWCRSELRPKRLADELPERGEYIPDFLDMLGMPGTTTVVRR